MMKKWYFDALMILVMGVFFTIVVYYNFQESYMTFALVPSLIFYYLGQYSQRKFGSSNKETA